MVDARQTVPLCIPALAGVAFPGRVCTRPKMFAPAWRKVRGRTRPTLGC